MILVTGGAGFIGSNIVETLGARIQGDNDIVVSDFLEGGLKWKNLRRCSLFDFVPPEELEGFLREKGGKIKAVIHMGAISSTTETDGDKVIRSNFQLSRRLWDFCTHRSIPFLYASSAATYGARQKDFEDTDSLKDLHNLRPLNLYGFSKNLFDKFAVSRREKNKPAPPLWVGFKFFNVYGPHEYHKGGQKSVANALFHQIHNNQPPRLFKSTGADYEDGGQSRDFVYVDDAVAAVLGFLDMNSAHYEHKSGLYNVGAGQSRAFKDVAACLLREMHSSLSVVYVDMPDALRPIYQNYTEAPIGKLQKAIPYKPHSLEEGLRKYVAYLREEEADLS